MTPKRFILLAILLGTTSIAFEATALADVFKPSTDAYHSTHIAFMAALVIGQFALYFSARASHPEARLALLFAIGATFTATGDFINGASSGIEPVSTKLTWALLWFGTGYLLYVVAMWLYNEPILKQSTSTSNFAKYRYAIALPILAANVAGWFMHVGPLVEDFELLRYGSFIFNATIYVAMPMLGIWFFRNSGWSAGGLVVLMGTLFIPFSDLILFASWLENGDPDVPSYQLYAYNWFVYFSGQVMISIFPALAIAGRERSEGSSIPEPQR
ncbi:MAG: hypothetical protein JHD02_03585 [Thermoleophilaceae bacterium]|nr:hypothetical protein [Thermoleophilaceae bacterium]